MPDRYRLHGIELQAFKVNFMTDYPDWFKEAIEKGTIYYQGGKHPYYTVEDGGYIERANAGDYITRNGDSIRVVRKDFFENHYEKILG